jgi:LmbE family N-acetylglucosaminyl deacetylase
MLAPLTQILLDIVLAIVTVLTGSVGASGFSPAQASVCTTANSRMTIVAHQDDDLLFINPATDTDVAAGRCLTTVYLTAGDAGRTPAYWHDREAGAMAAYAEMAGVADAWETSTLRTASGQSVTAVTLDGVPVRLIFLRLPTGSPHGYAIHNFECLSRLRAGSITTVHAVDGSASYTSASLRSTLTGFMTTYHPSVVRTLDYTGGYSDGDHADHHNAAYFAYEAQQNYPAEHTLTGFRGYPMTALPPNQPSSVAARKLSIFLAYAAHDSTRCNTAPTCRTDGRYWPWLSRSYEVSGPPDLDGR